MALRNWLYCGLWVLTAERVRAQPNLGLAQAQRLPLAEINGQPLTVDALKNLLTLLGSDAATVAAEPDLRVQFVHNAVDHQLLTSAAFAAQIDKSAEYAARLKVLQDDLLTKIYLEQQAAAASEAKWQEYFATHKDRFYKKEVRVLRLILSDRATAERVRQQLMTKTASFAKLAKLYASDPYDLGYIRAGQLPPDVHSFAFANPRGSISPIIPVKDQFWIVTLTDIKEGQPVTLDQVREDVVRLSRLESDQLVKDALRLKAKAVIHENAIRAQSF